MADFEAKDSKGRLITPAAKEQFLDALAKGESVESAARRVGRTKRGYDHWRKTDATFALQADTIIQRRQGKSEFICPDFPEFCETYLFQPLFEHQLRWWDVLRGEEPRNLHPSMVWSKGDEQMLLFNVPPGFAKSTTITTNYVVWRICKDPNVRVVIVSATEKMAKKFLYAIKQRLTHPTYHRLQREFGPDGGFRATAESWTATEIYLGGKDDGEKDPTVQAIGMGGQIYGTRADLICVDDAVLLKNAHQHEDQIDWLTQDVVTRLPEGEPDAKLLVIGTRVAPVDLYSQLRDTFKDEEENSVFTYFAQPAVLEYADSPENWVSLWPYTFDREGNQVAKWTGPQLKKRREKVKGSTWAMVYQQLDVSEDSVFQAAAIQSAVQGFRKPGVLVPGTAWWQREKGMSGLYIIGGLDPATAGYTAAVCIGVDRQTCKIWLIDAFNKKGALPRDTRRVIEDWTVRYGVNEWRIETNGFQRSIVQDDGLRSFLFSRGVILKPHWTGGNKADPDFGVASMSTLFEADGDGKPALLLPNNNGIYPAIAELCEQLVGWQAGVKGLKTDLVMALWFAVIRARELLFQAPLRQQTHMPNKFLSNGRSQRERVVINIEDELHKMYMEQ